MFLVSELAARVAANARGKAHPADVVTAMPGWPLS